MQVRKTQPPKGVQRGQNANGKGNCLAVSDSHVKTCIALNFDYERLTPALPAQDRKLVEAMALDAGASPAAILHQIVRAYLVLVRSAPEALPKDPLRRLTSSAIRREVR